MNVKSKNIVKLLIFIMLITLSLGNSIKGIDNAREDLGMLDSLKLTNEWGTEITEGSTLHNGSRYTLKYKFSLDDPSIDYKNKVAKIQLPAIFKPMSISPSTMPLIYNDGSQDQEIGTITC